MQLRNTLHAAKMYDHIWQHHKAIFDYVMIDAGCSADNLRIKGVQISEGPLYCQGYIVRSAGESAIISQWLDMEIAISVAFADPETNDIDQTRALQLLSQLPSPATVRDEDGRTLLQHACRNEWSDVANVLIREHIQCRVVDRTTILLAFEYSSTAGTDETCALQLLSHLPDPSRDIDEEGRSLLWTLLHYACKNEWDIVAKKLIQEHVEFKCQIPEPVGHFIALAFRYPSTTGTNECRALQILSQLPNPAAFESYWHLDILNFACENGWSEVVEVVIKKVMATDMETAVRMALIPPGLISEASALYLLSQLRNPTALMNEGDSTLLRRACYNEWADVASTLMEEYIQHPVLDPVIVFVAFEYPTVTGTDQARALQLLSQLHNPATVRDELENSWTLLHWACRNGWYQVVKALVEKYHCDPKFQTGLRKALKKKNSF